VVSLVRASCAHVLELQAAHAALSRLSLSGGKQPPATQGSCQPGKPSLQSVFDAAFGPDVDGKCFACIDVDSSTDQPTSCNLQPQN
jgi:hypothetical protein